jgi:UDP-N-acetylglucosamine 4-epimerase
VIPRWIATLMAGEPCLINGDGETSRDFCYVHNVVQANLLAATVQSEAALDRAYNIAVGERTTLNQLYGLIRDGLVALEPDLEDRVAMRPLYGPFRAGDVRHSLADIRAAQVELGYEPSYRTDAGIRRTLEWHLAQSGEPAR